MAEPSARSLAGDEPLPEAERRAKARPSFRTSPPPTWPRWATTPTATACWSSSSAREARAARRAGHVLPDHFLRTKVKPLVVDLPTAASVKEIAARLRGAHAPTGRTTPPLQRHAGPDSPPMRRRPGHRARARRRDISSGATSGPAAPLFYVNAINVMRGGSSYAPIAEWEKFRIVLGPGRGQARPDARTQAARHAGRTRDRGGVGDRQGDRGAAGRRGRVRGRRRPGRDQGRRRGRRDRERRRRPSGWAPTCPTRTRSPPRSTRPCCRRGRPGGQQRRVVDLGVFGAHGRPGPAARRDGQGLVLGLPGRGEGDDRAGDGATSSTSPARTRCSRARTTSRTGSTKADQAHQVRLLAAELGPHGIRVNGINPDGVVRGSGIFAGRWAPSGPRSTG